MQKLKKSKSFPPKNTPPQKKSTKTYKNPKKTYKKQKQHTKTQKNNTKTYKTYKNQQKKQYKNLQKHEKKPIQKPTKTYKKQYKNQQNLQKTYKNLQKTIQKPTKPTKNLQKTREKPDPKKYVPPASSPRGEHIFRKGEPVDAVYVVESGELSVVKPLRQGDEEIFCLFERSVFGRKKEFFFFFWKEWLVGRWKNFVYRLDRFFRKSRGLQESCSCWRIRVIWLMLHFPFCCIFWDRRRHLKPPPWGLAPTSVSWASSMTAPWRLFG